MECQTTQGNDVLCSNGYYGFQPLLNGAGAGGGGEGAGGVYDHHEERIVSVSNGHLLAGGHAGALAWQQRKRSRDDEAAASCGNGADLAAAAGLLNGTSAAKASQMRLSRKFSTSLARFASQGTLFLASKT